jgi:hypothetical protein
LEIQNLAYTISGVDVMAAPDALLKAKSDKPLAKVIEPDVLIRCSG